MLDNLSTPKTNHVERFLAEQPQVRFHFTPTYSSWFNQVELWFAKIQREVIRRGVFTSVADLGRKLANISAPTYSRLSRSAGLTAIPYADCVLTKRPGQLSNPPLSRARRLPGV